MSYPSIPQYGHAYQQPYGQSPYDSQQQNQYFNRPLDHSISQQQYGSNPFPRPNVPQHNSWSAPPPYSQQDLSPALPPRPPPGPTHQQSYGTQLSATNSQNQYGLVPPAPAPSPAARPVSPLPASEAEYRGRLQAAGVSEQQIAMILGSQTTPQPSNPINDMGTSVASLQSLSINEHSRADTKSKSYPFNLPKSEPIILQIMNPPVDDEKTFGIVPPNSPYSSRMYTGEWMRSTERIRPDLQLRFHKDRDIEYSRVAGTCTFSAKSMNFTFPWLEWGDWHQASGTRTRHFDSDTGILNKQVMYWEKDTKGHHGNPNLFVVRCKVTDQALDAEERPKPDDRVIVTFEVRPEPDPEIITIAPGIIERQDQLDELLMIGLSVKQKFHLDMALWLRDNKKLDYDDISDVSMVPDDVDGWGGENTTDTADAKAAKKARWKERAKLFGSSAKLAHQVGQFSMNIAAMQGT